MKALELTTPVINLIFRNPTNTDISYTLDKAKILTVKDLKNDLSHRINTNITSKDQDKEEAQDQILRLFFYGKPLNDTDEIEILNLTDNDVILYMKAIQSPPAPEIISSNLLEENTINSNRTIDADTSIFLQRGFNRFVYQGISIEDIQIFRWFFHSTIYQHSFHNGIELSWSREDIWQREERWLISQRNRFASENITNDFFSINNTRVGESNMNFFKGFVIGLLSNIFGFLFLLLFSLKPKFEAGMKWGIVLSIIATVLILWIRK